jgi:FMN-dependent NADH-azoreductase
MSNVLLVTASPRGTDSYSSRVGRDLARKLAGKAAKIVHRDLGANPPPHIEPDFVRATRSGANDLSEAQREAAKRADELIREVEAADVIVIAAALINFSAPTALKAWIDHLAVPQRTFRYTEKGPEGLIKGKKVYVVQASAGVYSDGPMAAHDYQTPWLKFTLGFLGMSDVEIIRVEGVAFGPEAIEKTLAAANARIEQVTPLAA